jgi:hypothetical protein
MMYPIYIDTSTCSLASIAEALFVVANKKSVVRGIKEKPAVAAKKPTAESPAAVTVDRRDNRNRRQGLDRRTHKVPVGVEQRVVVQRRAKVNRRRQIDPTTCERDYTPDEIEFMSAMDSYKRSSGRMFPTCSEVLEVITSLGYEKWPKTGAPLPPAIDLLAPVELTAAAASAVHLV